MRIHVHNRFSSHQNRFFHAELQGLGQEVSILPGGPDLAHRTQAERVRGWASLLRSAWKKSGRSLSAQPRPDVVFFNTHLEALIFAVRRRLARGERPRAALASFIVAQPKPGISGWLRRAYYGRVLGAVDMAVCHSREELSRYMGWYPKHAHRLRFHPFGFALDPHGEADSKGVKLPDVPYLFSAGRSSRDYATLIGAARGLDIPLYIACDSHSELSGSDLPSNVTVLRTCYGPTFRRWMQGAQVAITPLEPVIHSAGQMVVMQALALGVPQIVTDVPGIRGYTDEGKVVELVPPRDVEALRVSIQNVFADSALRKSLRERGRSFFQSHLTRNVHWRTMFEMVAALQDRAAEPPANRKSRSATGAQEPHSRQRRRPDRPRTRRAP